MGSEFFAYLSALAPSLNAKRLRLEVEEENFRARKLYERMGFVPLAYNQMIREDF